MIAPALVSLLWLAAPPQDSSSALVQVAARQYGADSQATGSYAGNSGLDLVEGHVWSDETLCTSGSSSIEPTPTPPPAIGWKYSARITRTGDEFVVTISWRRVWDRIGRGAGANGGASTKMKLGDRQELDRIEIATPGACGAASLRLEVAIVAPLTTRPTAAGGRGGAGGTFSGAGGAGRAGASGSGAGGSGAGARGAGMSGAGGAGGVGILSSGRIGASTTSVTVAADPQRDEAIFRLRLLALLNQLRAKVDSNPALIADVDALRQMVLRPLTQLEVWLVHTRPDGVEDTVRRQRISFDTSMTIVFPAVVVATTQGSVSVQVTGMLSVSQGTPEPLQVRISRRVTGDGPPALDSTGGSDQSMAMPKPDEVLSFELPPVKDRASTLLTGHQFSLRLRVLPSVPVR